MHTSPASSFPTLFCTHRAFGAPIHCTVSSTAQGDAKLPEGESCLKLSRSPQLGMCWVLKAHCWFRSEPLFFCLLLWVWSFSAFCSHSKYFLPFLSLPHSAANHRKVRRRGCPRERPFSPCLCQSFAGGVDLVFSNHL